MKKRFLFLLTLIVTFFVLLAVMSGFFTLIFRDTRRGPLGEYLVEYLFPRFMGLFMIFLPTALIGTAALVVGWLIYELCRDPKR